MWMNGASYPKHSLNVSSYRLLSVKRELDDLVLQMQQPSLLRYIFDLWKPNIVFLLSSDPGESL